jgi:hypothetical protein
LKISSNKAKELLERCKKIETVKNMSDFFTGI